MGDVVTTHTRGQREAVERSDACYAQVVVAEGAPRYGGQELARKLAQAGLQTTAIPDAAIFAMMARVNKVPCQTHHCLATSATCSIKESINSC